MSVPKFQGIVKGTISDIPDTIKSRAVAVKHNWDEFEVGDHRDFPNDASGIKARASATAFSRGSKTRAPSKFGSRTVEQDGTKVIQIWRLADPITTEVKSEADPVLEEVKSEVKTAKK